MRVHQGLDNNSGPEKERVIFEAKFRPLVPHQGVASSSGRGSQVTHAHCGVDGAAGSLHPAGRQMQAAVQQPPQRNRLLRSCTRCALPSGRRCTRQMHEKGSWTGMRAVCCGV
jgi:hypothetical protein